jgi:hypothetical protein
MGKHRPLGVLMLAACSLGVADEGGIGSASIASEGSQGSASSATSGDDAGSSDGTDGHTSNPSDPTNDPTASESDSDPTAGGEVCNGLDDDGDGSIDEDVPDVSCGQGVCMVTVAGCEGGVPAQCFPGASSTESCNGLDDDCDGTADEDLVQSCDSACGVGTQTCSAGAWGQCDAPPPMAESCDVADNDCNGAVDDGVGGCRQYIHRWYQPMTGEHFYSTDANEGYCCGYQMEVMNFFQLYSGAHPMLTAFYRCYNAGNGMHHYTTDSNCEGLTVEGVIGYIGTASLPGSTALYRSYNPMNGDHFFTNSMAEHDYAVDSLGFTDEGIVGYVW